MYGALFSDNCLARQNLQAQVPSNELLSMKHHILFSASGSRSKGKTTQNLGSSSCLHARKNMFSLGFNMRSFAGSMLQFRWLLAVSSTVPPYARPASTTRALHGLGACVLTHDVDRTQLCEKHHLKRVWSFSIEVGPKRAALSCLPGLQAQIA